MVKLPTARNPRHPMSLMDSLFSDLFVPHQENAADGWMPAVEVRETPDAYEVEAELPGVDPDQIEITLEKDMLTLKGTREVRARSDDDRVHISERRFGAFERQFNFPQQVDADAVEAKWKDGILGVRINKSRAAKARRIEVKRS